MRPGLIGVALVVALIHSQDKNPDTFNVRDFGAVGNGRTKETRAIEAAVSAAARQGGGTVFIPAGTYLSGTIHLRDNIGLHLAPGAVLKTSGDKEDFDANEKLDYNSFADDETTYSHFALVAGDNVRNVSITGHGMIDGNRSRRGGPKPIALKNCRDITIRDIKIENAPNYCISVLGCEYVTVDNVTIRNAYSDGIDPDCSQRVRISNCSVESRDDAICLKASLALGVRKPTEHVTITNCILSSAANCIKLGTESSGDFTNIAINNCAMYIMPNSRGSSGLAIESVDGAVIDGLVASNLTMHDVFNPLFIRLGNRGRGLSPPKPGDIRNVSISHLAATGATMTCSITGIPGSPVHRVSLSDIQIFMSGGQNIPIGLNVPEMPDKYPESKMFGVLPAYGLYARHVEELKLTNFRVRGEEREPEMRPALVVDDGLFVDIQGLTTGLNWLRIPVIWLNNTRVATIHESSISGFAFTYLRVTGARTSRIVMTGKDLLSVPNHLEVKDGAPRNEVKLRN